MRRLLPFMGEKSFQQCFRLIGCNSIVDLGHMVALRVGKHPSALRDPARFRIGSAKIQTRDAGLADGRGTHRARFKRHIQRMTRKAFRAGCRAGRPDRQDFGMRRRVMQLTRSVAGSRDNLAGRRHHDGPDRNLVAFAGLSGLGQRGLHVTCERHAPVIARTGPIAKPLSLAR